MNKWSIYQSDKDYTNKKKVVLGTFELLVWLMFGKKSYIVAINRMKEPKGDK